MRTYQIFTNDNIAVASADRNLGKTGFSLHIDQNNSSSSQPLNGDCPINISYKSTPNDHQSTL